MAIDKAEALQIDKQAADRHIEAFKTIAQSQVTQRGFLLNAAIQNFNDFSKLPESSSMAGAIWDAAFGVLSVAVPLFRLAPFIATAHRNATLAIEITKAIGDKAKKTDLVIKAITAATQNGATFVQKANDVKDVAGKVQAAFKGEEGVTSLVDHVSRKPILDLVTDLNNVVATWLMARGAVDAEWILRLDDVKVAGSLEATAKKILPDLPVLYGDKEIKELESLYLYLMVGEFMRRNVKVVETQTTYIYDLGRPNQVFQNIDVTGLNDNQWKQIEAWFGRGVSRGKLFGAAPYTGNKVEFARSLSVPVEKNKKMIDNGSWRRSKM